VIFFVALGVYVTMRFSPATIIETDYYGNNGGLGTTVIVDDVGVTLYNVTVQTTTEGNYSTGVTLKQGQTLTVPISIADIINVFGYLKPVG